MLGDDDLAAEVVPPKVPVLESQVPEFEHARAIEQIEFAALAELAAFQAMEQIEFAALAAAHAARRGGAPPSGVPGPEPKVPLPESPHDIIEEVIRQEIKATTDVPISLSPMPSSSIVPAVPAGQTSVPATSLPCLTSLQHSQHSGLFQRLGLSTPNNIPVVFDSMMDQEVALTVFDRMLAGASAPFAGSPDLRSGTMDTSKNPVWLLFGYDHGPKTFSSVYDVTENPNHGDRGF